jgi:hypothetical protein
MAKRVRGTTSRPGQRRPLQRSAARPAAKPAAPSTEAPARPGTEVPARPPDSLTAAEEARAAELEAAIVAEERAAEEEASRRRTRATRSTEAVPSARPGSNLAVQAAEEYSYVARDVRRIAIVGGSLVGILLVIWILGHVAGMGL